MLPERPHFYLVFSSFVFELRGLDMKHTKGGACEYNMVRRDIHRFQSHIYVWLKLF